jgi:hypothetical protein
MLNKSRARFAFVILVKSSCMHVSIHVIANCILGTVESQNGAASESVATFRRKRSRALGGHDAA